MKAVNLVRNPILILSCILLISIASSLLWHSVCDAHKTTRINAVARELRVRSEFSHVYFVSNHNALYPQLKGNVQNEADFISLTNLICGLAPDVPMEVWIDWSKGSTPNHEAGGIATTIGGRGAYDKVSDNLSSVSFLSATVFLSYLVAMGFWQLWKRICTERKPWRDLPVLVLAPFVSLIVAVIPWWNLPDFKSNLNPWLVFQALFITMGLFVYCLYSMVKGRYRFLSALGILVSGLAALPECFLATRMMVGLFLK